MSPQKQKSSSTIQTSIDLGYERVDDSERSLPVLWITVCGDWIPTPISRMQRRLSTGGLLLTNCYQIEVEE